MSISRSRDWEDEQRLWQDFKAGDRDAFDLLYQQHIQQLIRYGFKVTRDRDLIQDCIQDLFVELWESRQSIANAHSIKHYLLKALRYKLIRSSGHTVTEPLPENEFPADDETIENKILREETVSRQSRQLTDALKQLPKRQQEALHLRFFQELTNEQVAQVMGVNYQSACKFIYTGLKTLRDLLLLSFLLPVAFSVYKEILKIF
ncbi:RNA polymerase sigma factor [Dyadobacter arcticus]|uniref:RNA polymerase sigma factor (Sigma-70 family) n=1 Tax=Dyadobacter arcticus TaxID=1078754 RepID=A0ABX0UNT1_9BACT|nr:sigma-70 family RNA polymerase sigma factor [Dyadobacter arcticus]NIJ54647.1 RNA polymerase sigma factor (sigma-70 family) [Dyadobacter arcticus]